jgi:TRAP-type C4-dicarboxylate transport system permease small subunit
VEGGPDRARAGGQVTAPARVAGVWQRFANAVATGGLGVVFLLFIYGVGMRYLANRPVSWIDEAVTVLAVWTVLWTAAFVLRWSEHISFDIVFASMAPERQRWMLLTVTLAFVALMGAAMPALVSYTLFLWRERTDMLQMRMDFVYAIFPIFMAVALLRLAWTAWRLVSPRWREELADWHLHTEDVA